jgi:hypothetical protein
LAHECFVRVDGRAAIAELGCCKPLFLLETLAVKLFSTYVRNHAASPHHAKSILYGASCFLFVRRMPDSASAGPLTRFGLARLRTCRESLCCFQLHLCFLFADGDLGLRFCFYAAHPDGRTSIIETTSEIVLPVSSAPSRREGLALLVSPSL